MFSRPPQTCRITDSEEPPGDSEPGLCRPEDHSFLLSRLAAGGLPPLPAPQVRMARGISVEMKEKGRFYSACVFEVNP